MCLIASLKRSDGLPRKRALLAGTRQSMSGISQNQSDNAEGHTNTDSLSAWRSQYRSLSALLNDLECPIVFRLTAKTSQIAAQLQSLLDQWIKDGRPQIDWPESYLADRPHQESRTPTLRSHSSLPLTTPLPFPVEGHHSVSLPSQSASNTSDASQQSCQGSS